MFPHLDKLILQKKLTFAFKIAKKAALKFSEERPVIYFYMGKINFLQKNYQSANLKFIACLVLGESNLELYKWICWTNLMLRLPEQAQYYANEAINKHNAFNDLSLNNILSKCEQLFGNF